MRMTALSAIHCFVAILAVSGCAGTEEPPKADNKPKVAETPALPVQLPQAPAPRLKKTQTELLVGRWKTIKTDNEKLPDAVKPVFEFTQEGKFTFRSPDPVRGAQERTGI